MSFSDAHISKEHISDPNLKANLSRSHSSNTLDDTNQNDSESPLSAVNISLDVASFILAIIIVSFNVLILFFIRTVHTLKTRSNIYIASLALVDLCVGFSVIFSATNRIADSNFRTDPLNCAIRLSITQGMVLTSVLHLGLISVDRFLCIHLPYDYRHYVTPSRIVATVIAVWVCGLTFVIYPIIIYRPRRGQYHEGCSNNIAFEPLYTAVPIAVIFVACTLLDMIMYGMIMHTAAMHEKKIASIKSIFITSQLNSTVRENRRSLMEEFHQRISMEINKCTQRFSGSAVDGIRFLTPAMDCARKEMNRSGGHSRDEDKAYKMEKNMVLDEQEMTPRNVLKKNVERALSSVGSCATSGMDQISRTVNTSDYEIISSSEINTSSAAVVVEPSASMEIIEMGASIAGKEMSVKHYSPTFSADADDFINKKPHRHSYTRRSISTGNEFSDDAREILQEHIERDKSNQCCCCRSAFPKHIKFLLYVSGVSTSLLTPFVVCINLDYLFLIPNWIFEVTQLTAAANSAANFIIFLMLNSHFRNALYRTFGCKKQNSSNALVVR